MKLFAQIRCLHEEETFSEPQAVITRLTSCFYRSQPEIIQPKKSTVIPFVP